jgi:hypothetical protein
MRPEIQKTARELAAYLVASPGAASREAVLASQARSLKAALGKCRDPESRQELREALAKLENRMTPQKFKEIADGN